MRAFVLTRYGTPYNSFELQEKQDLPMKEHEVRIAVEAFGLNYADVSARNGTYRDAPPKPCVIGYEVVGRVLETGAKVTSLQTGDRVMSFSFFGGYATQVVVPEQAAVKIPENLDAGIALALVVQFSTAWFCAEERVRLRAGDHVLIHAAAGGVGTALIQLAKRRGCVVYGTAGADSKLELVKSLGADYAINYRKQDFVEEIRKLRGSDGLDVVFDSVGGSNFKRSYKLLIPTGRIVGYGAAQQPWLPGILGGIQLLFRFGFYNPAFLLMQSRSIIGVNMVRVGVYRPAVLRACMENVMELFLQGEIKPVVGGEYPSSRLGEAHEHLESRGSIGKLYVRWEKADGLV